MDEAEQPHGRLVRTTGIIDHMHMNIRSTPTDQGLELVEISDGYVIPARQPVSRGANPFVVCWGDHPGRCPLLDGRRHDRPSTHGIVVELDYDDETHRMLLRWLRRAAERSSEVVPVPRITAVTKQTPERTKP